MSYELRDYQIDCIETIKKVFEKEHSQLIQLPTGSGKTWIFLNYLKKYSPTALIICPTRDLQQQIWEVGKIFLGEKNISLGVPKNEKKFPYYVVTAASLNFKKNQDFLYWQDFQTVIIDEAHRAQSDTYRNFLEDYDCYYQADILGCTATPERLDRKDLMEIFNFISYDLNLVDMIEKGYLCDIEAYRIKTGCKLSSSRLGKSGDFLPIHLKQLNTKERNDIITNVFKNECYNKKTLVFCVSVDHARTVSHSLKEAGYKSAYIDGTMSMNLRKEILRKFKTGEYQVLCNCQLLTEGFDEPTIEALIVARPTKSKSLYCQMLGRGVRKLEGKDICYLYELTDNAHNICTFSSAANNDIEFDFDYKNGKRFSELAKDLEKLTHEEVLVKKEKFDLFPKNTNIFESVLNCIPPTETQKKLLEKIDQNIRCIHPSMLESAFFIWKQKKMVEYGLV